MAKIDLYFKNLNGTEKLPVNIFDVLFPIDDLFKLIKYSEDPLNPANTITDEEKRAMIDISPSNDARRIYFSMFNDVVIDDEQTQLRIYVARDTSRNNVLSDIIIGFDVLCHNKLVEIIDEEGQPINRLLKMRNIIWEYLNGEVIPNSIGVLFVPQGAGSVLIPFNKSFQGYRFTMMTKAD